MVVYESGWNGMCPDWFETVSEMCDTIYIYIYIYIYICKSCKSDMGKNKSILSSYIFSLSGATNRLIGNNQWLKILISELEYVDLWITCVLIHCFTGGSHCLGWCGPGVHPSLPGFRMPVLRIVTVDEKFGLGYSEAQNIEHIEIKEHLIKITPNAFD